MDINTVKIINSNFDFLGEIEDYISFYFVRNFTKAKGFQIIAPIKYLDILKNENIIFITPKKAGIVEEVAVDESKKIIIAKGRDLKSIIGRRITVPPIGKAYDDIKATTEEVIKHYLVNNCINPIDSKRKVSQLYVDINKKRGSTIAWQSRYKYLDFELEQICNATGIGWEIYLDLDKKRFIFDVVEGVDRTEEYNSRVIFSEEFDNIANSTHTNNSLSYKTMGYVAGQGEGEDRAVQEVFKTEDTGLDRRELFIDARDISEDNKLGDRAKAKLAEWDYITSNESTVINSNFIYEKDWDLGDIVILKNSLGESSQRVAEVTEVYEGERKIDIVLGNIIPLPSEKLANEVNSTPNINSPSKVWRPYIDSNGNLTWTLNSSLDIPEAQNIRGPKGSQGEIGLQGIQGIPGIGLNFIWNGTQLGVKREDEVSYKYVDIKGQKGDTGIQGKSLEFNWNGTQLGIRVEGQTSYTYVDLKGQKGDQGIQGERGLQGIQGLKGDKGDKIKHQWSGTVLKLENPDGTFDAGVDLKGSKGDKGEQGPQGIQGVQGPAGNGQSYVVFQKYFIATDGQKIFSWNDGYVYTVGINAIAVYINGVRVGNKAFKELNGSSIEFINTLSSGDNVFIEAMQAVVDLQGPKGDKGDKGDTGAIGPQGVQGVQGPKGLDGKNLEFTWNGTQLGVRQQGQSNYTLVNLQGPQGVKGDIGPQGIQGPKGDTGGQGIQGIKGDDGATFIPSVDINGNIIWTNDKGLTNPITRNIKGPKGDTGLKGDKGDIGIQGPQGIQGDPGKNLEFTWNGTQLGVRQQGESNYTYVNLQGPQGIQGIKGDKGDTGATGAIGAQGAKGDTWRPTIDVNGNISWALNNGTTIPTTINIKGPKGDTGAQGIQGPQGIKGDTGAVGPQGAQGIPGKDGTQIIVSSVQPTGVPKGTVWI